MKVLLLLGLVVVAYFALTREARAEARAGIAGKSNDVLLRNGNRSRLFGAPDHGAPTPFSPERQGIGGLDLGRVFRDSIISETPLPRPSVWRMQA